MEQPNKHADELKYLLINMVKKFRSYLESQISNFDCDLTVQQVLVIQSLYHHPDISIKDLSEHIGSAKSTTCGIVDRLVQKDMVIRKSDPNDRRNVKLSLNPKTYEMNNSIDMIKTNFLSDLLKELEEAEIDEILKSLRKLNSLVENHTL